ncbi:hypothetical protein GC176_07405 [bacterium]|nr:hypothetical protein [bacterium]
MNRLQLATLISWAGERGIEGRKRLQKVVFFLQQAGCPLDCQYTLHYYGPYSRDVADACDEMVTARLVTETGGPQSGGAYAYTLAPWIHAVLADTPNAEMQPFERLGRDLISESIWSLELGSTILFFYRQTSDWNQALAKACEFKKVPADTEASQVALGLAQRVDAATRN